MKFHPNSAFDADLKDLQSKILAMGGMVEKAISDSTKAFVQRDTELAQKVVSGDAAIDRLETEINNAVVRMLALRQPAASDLHEVVGVMKVAGDLERLGDYAKNLGKRVAVLSQSETIDGTSAAMKRLSSLVQPVASPDSQATTTACFVEYWRWPASKGDRHGRPPRLRTRFVILKMQLTGLFAF